MKSPQKTKRANARRNRSKIAKSRRPVRPVNVPPGSTEALVSKEEAPTPGAKDQVKGTKTSPGPAKGGPPGKTSLEALFPRSLKQTWAEEATEQQALNIASARECYTTRGLVLYLGAGISS